MGGTAKQYRDNVPWNIHSDGELECVQNCRSWSREQISLTFLFSPHIEQLCAPYAPEHWPIANAANYHESSPGVQRHIPSVARCASMRFGADFPNTALDGGCDSVISLHAVFQDL